MKRMIAACLLGAGLAGLGEASSVEPMEQRVYPIESNFLERMSVDEEIEAWMKKEGLEIPLREDGSSRREAACKCALGLLGVDWPKGSSIAHVKELDSLKVLNTPENLAKLEKILDEFARKPINVEIDTLFVETGRMALEAVGYFDTNRVDAAVLQERLLARQDAKLLESLRVVTRLGDEVAAKCVDEYIYPTEYALRLPPPISQCATTTCDDKVLGTNSCQCVLAAVEPQSFAMREVGVIVAATPEFLDNSGLIDLKYEASLVGEPEWKDYGAKAKCDGAMAYDLAMEQPFFPVMASVNAVVSVRPGHTLVFGGVADSRRGNEDKFVLVFVTTRIADCDRDAYARLSRRLSAPEIRRKFESEGMEAWTFHHALPICEVRATCHPDGTPKTPEEIAAEIAAEVAQSEREWRAFYTSIAGIDWPQGSAVHGIVPLGRLWVKNTPENLAKIAKALADLNARNRMVEFDLRYFSANRKTLSEVGFFGTNHVNAAVLQNRLMTHDGAKLVGAPRLATVPGEEAVLKGVMEYIYPLDYTVKYADPSQTDGSNTVYGIGSAGVEPQSFTMHEAGTVVVVHATPRLSGDGNCVDTSFSMYLAGEPEWKDYGAKAKWKGAATYDLPMEQPFFPDRACTDAKVSMKPGATYVFGGGADRRKGDEDKFVLVFVTPRWIEP